MARARRLVARKEQDMNDIVKRLRKLGTDSVGNYGMPIATEAADEIERLQANWDGCADTCSRLHKEIERLSAKILRQNIIITKQSAEIWNLGTELAEATRTKP
jgi:hypothetical protein